MIATWGPRRAVACLVSMFLSACALGPEEPSELMSAVMNRNAVAVEEALSNGERPDQVFLGGSPIQSAARTGDVEILAQLIAAGANPNFDPSKDGAPLQLSLMNAESEAARVLIEAGAEVCSPGYLVNGSRVPLADLVGEADGVQVRPADRAATAKVLRQAQFACEPGPSR